MAPKIPDRWKDYKPVGEKIEGTRFIAFKVPLKEHIARNVASDIRLDGNILMKTIPNLGLIIDLTNTNRYYDPKIFQNEGVEYKKLMIPGHETPPKYLVDRFIKLVKEFMDNNPDNDKLIGVHCTHGVNRTGYLICNYMISQMTIEPNEALNRFANARGHKIERNNYIDALQKLLDTNVGQKTVIDNLRAENKDRIEINTCNENKESKESEEPNNERSRRDSYRDNKQSQEVKRNNERSRSNQHSSRDSKREYEGPRGRKRSSEHFRRESNRDQEIRAKRSKANYLSNRNESTTRSSSSPPFFANNRRNDNRRSTDNYSTNNRRDSNRNHDIRTKRSQDNNLRNLSNPILSRNEELLRNFQMSHQRQPPPLRVDYYNNRTINRPPHNNYHMQLLPQNEGQLIIPYHMTNQQQPTPPPRLRLDYYNARPVKDTKRNNRHMQRFAYVHKTS